jgi:ADP-ribose pyrophosphatase YjhB (NUDIX family)
MESVEREVLEETGVEVKFDCVIAVRQVSGGGRGPPGGGVISEECYVKKIGCRCHLRLTASLQHGR